MTRMAPIGLPPRNIGTASMLRQPAALARSWCEYSGSFSASSMWTTARVRIPPPAAPCPPGRRLAARAHGVHLRQRLESFRRVVVLRRDVDQFAIEAAQEAVQPAA